MTIAAPVDGVSVGVCPARYTDEDTARTTDNAIPNSGPRARRRPGAATLRVPLDLRPAVLERDGPVEHRLPGGGVFVDAEVADALELDACFGGQRGGDREE